jgi:hypothetical protein
LLNHRRPAEIEGATQPVGEVDKGVAAQNRRSAAAPMQTHNASSTDCSAEKIDLRPEEIGIGRDRAHLAHRPCGAATVETELGAIGDM